jgi:hypothetical protein
MADFTRWLRLSSAAVLLTCALAASGCTNQNSESMQDSGSMNAAPEQTMHTPPHPVAFPSGMTGSHATQP